MKQILLQLNTAETILDKAMQFGILARTPAKVINQIESVRNELHTLIMEITNDKWNRT